MAGSFGLWLPSPAFKASQVVVLPPRTPIIFTHHGPQPLFVRMAKWTVLGVMNGIEAVGECTWYLFHPVVLCENGGCDRCGEKRKMV
jgi:hypothetical protein